MVIARLRWRIVGKAFAWPVATYFTFAVAYLLGGALQGAMAEPGLALLVATISTGVIIALTFGSPWGFASAGLIGFGTLLLLALGLSSYVAPFGIGNYGIVGILVAAPTVVGVNIANGLIACRRSLRRRGRPVLLHTAP